MHIIPHAKVELCSWKRAVGWADNVLAWVSSGDSFYLKPKNNMFKLFVKDGLTLLQGTLRGGRLLNLSSGRPIISRRSKSCQRNFWKIHHRCFKREEENCCLCHTWNAGKTMLAWSQYQTIHFLVGSSPALPPLPWLERIYKCEIIGENQRHFMR